MKSPRKSVSQTKSNLFDAVWLPKLFYPVIIIFAGFSGFFYTDRYSGWGHGSSTAVPVAVGLVFFSFLAAAITVSEMKQRTTNLTLAGFAAFWIFFTALVFFAAPK